MRGKKPSEADPISVSRQGKKAITTYLEPAVYKQFKILAVENDVSGEALVYEALNEVFKKYNKPAIAIKVER